MIIRCANCGQEHYTRPIVDAKEGVMIWQWRAVRIQGPVSLSMMAFLVANMRGTVSTQDIVAAVWPDPDDEPEIPENVICVTMSRLRPRLKRLGLEIVTICWNGGFYLRAIPPVASALSYDAGKRSSQPVAQSECLESA